MTSGVSILLVVFAFSTCFVVIIDPDRFRMCPLAVVAPSLIADCFTDVILGVFCKGVIPAAAALFVSSTMLGSFLGGFVGSF